MLFGSGWMPQQSERLTYRLFRPEDKTELAKMLTDDSMTRAAGFPAIHTAGELDDFFCALTRDNAALAVLLGQHLVGFVHVHDHFPGIPRFADKACVMLGFMIAPAYQGKGYATEAAGYITRFLKTRYDDVFAGCFEDNPASRAVIEKPGFRFLTQHEIDFKRIGKRVVMDYYI